MPIVGLGTWPVSHRNMRCLYILSIAPHKHLKQRYCGVLGYDCDKVREVINNVLEEPTASVSSLKLEVKGKVVQP